MQPSFDVAGVLNSKQYNSWQLRSLDAVRRCRTASLGAHVDGCTECGHVRLSYNSCRNRHCPKCQGREREKWIRAREAELLPVPYFHVVFTLPDTLNRLCLYKPEVMYALLFSTAWSVLSSFAQDGKHLGAQTGMISILHTWGQTMSLHPHLHCIVPGGGLTKQGKWKGAKTGGKFLFPVKAMSKVFRGRYIAALKEALPDQISKELLGDLYKHQWVVYAKRPFLGPASVVEYLGRYTHKIAISNHRIKNHEEGKVSFSYKDYRHGSVKKEMTLEATEFIRRFALHILPKGQLKVPALKVVKKDTAVIFNVKQCPCCKKDTMETIMRFHRRGPPQDWKTLAQDLLALITNETP